MNRNKLFKQKIDNAIHRKTLSSSFKIEKSLDTTSEGGMHILSLVPKVKTQSKTLKKFFNPDTMRAETKDASIEPFSNLRVKLDYGQPINELSMRDRDDSFHFMPKIFK